MRRVMVVGQPGSGKSTVARALGAATGLPVVHLDRLHWMAGWRERPRAERDRLFAEAEAGERWIIEGNYSATWDVAGGAGRPDRLARPAAGPAALAGDAAARCATWAGPGRTWRRAAPSGSAAHLGLLRWIWSTRRTGREAMARLAAGAACPVARLALGPGGRGLPSSAARPALRGGRP